MASLSSIFALKRKVEQQERRLVQKKKGLMIDYLCAKFEAAEILENLDRAKSDEQIKACILEGLPAEQYGEYIQQIRGQTMSVMGENLIEFEKSIVNGKGDAAAARRRLDRMTNGGNIIVILTFIMIVLFNITSNPPEGLFFPFGHNTDCTCDGSGVQRVCKCLPYLFLLFQGAMAGAFTIATVVGLRVTRDYNLYWWIFAALGLISFAFAVCILAATPRRYRRHVLIVDGAIVVPLFLLMGLARYWRNVWAIFKLSLVGVWVNLVRIVFLGWNLFTCGLWTKSQGILAGHQCAVDGENTTGGTSS